MSLTDPNPRILIVGPIDLHLDQCSTALSRAGYSVEHATTVDAKRRIILAPWNVVILAHSVGYVRRRALAEWIRERGIPTRVITIHPSGTLSRTPVDARASVEDSPTELVRAVQAVLGSGEARQKRNRLLFLTCRPFSPLARVTFLKTAGYEVILATTMKEVKEACRKATFDLVIFGPGYTKLTRRNFYSVFRKQHGPVRLLQIGTDIPHYTTYMSNEEVLVRVQACLSSGESEPPSAEGGTSSGR